MGLFTEQNALSAAIQTWPEHVRNIAFVLRLEDFIWPDYEHKLMSKNHGESAKVSTEYLPTKDDMGQFLGQLAKLRTGLKHFSLVIYVRHHPKNGGIAIEKTLESHHDFPYGRTTHDSEPPKPTASLQEQMPPPHNAPTVFRIHQTTVDRLYESWIEDCRYYSDDYHNPAEYREEREMDTECREDAANEAAFGLLSDEELETYWE